MMFTIVNFLEMKCCFDGCQAFLRLTIVHGEANVKLVFFHTNNTCTKIKQCIPIQIYLHIMIIPNRGNSTTISYQDTQDHNIKLYNN